MPFEAADVVYLEMDDVLQMLAEAFGCSTTTTAHQLRSPDGLEAVLACPRQYAYYQQADLALQATVLVHGIAETQPFLDGNKRTATLAMTVFLAYNGRQLDVTGPELAGWILSLSGSTTAEPFADLIRPHLAPTR